jgi:hypothetical protein
MMKAFKKILALFLAISMMMNGVGFCADSSDILDFLPAFVSARPSIKSLSTTTAAPFELIKINGSGFSRISDLVVTFSNGSYVVNVLPVDGTANTLEVSVPFFVDTTTGSLGSGVVNVTVARKSYNIQSNSISGFTISELPYSSDAPGSVTVAFLQDLQTLALDAQSQLTFLQEASNGQVDTTSQIASLNLMTLNLTDLLGGITNIMNGQEAPGLSPTINQQSLSNSDRILLGYLNQLDNIGKASLSSITYYNNSTELFTLANNSIPNYQKMYAINQISFVGFYEFWKKSAPYVGTAVMLAAPIIGPELLGAYALAYSIPLAASAILSYTSFKNGLSWGDPDYRDFKPVADRMITACLELGGLVNMPSKLAALIHFVSQSKRDFELSKELLEPVLENEAIIRDNWNPPGITAQGSWVGTMTWDNGPTESFSAELQQTQYVVQGYVDYGGVHYEANGETYGYEITFNWNIYSGDCLAKLQMAGKFSQDGSSMHGDFVDTYSCTIAGTTLTETATGTWVLSKVLD